MPSSSDVLCLDVEAALWLVPAKEEPGIVWRDETKQTPHHRYRELASTQKIYFAPLSMAHDLRLEQEFEALGVAAPTVEQARKLFASVENIVGASYAFEQDPRDQDIWRIRNRTQPDWTQDPLLRHDDWILFVQCNDLTQRVPLKGHEVSDALSWLPLLDGHHSAEEVERAFYATDARQRVAAALNNVSAFTSMEEEDFDLHALPELLFLSHSSVLVRGSGENAGAVLIDPAFLSSTEMLARPGRRPFEIATHVDAVVVSHCHWDHLSFQTMIRIPRTTTFFVPKSRTPSLANPPIARYLKAFGFTDVREVSSDWETARIDVDGDIDVTFVPFFGEPFGLDSRFDAFTYLVRSANHGTTIYGSLDACHDEAGTMDPVFDELARKSEIDVFLFGSSAYTHDPLYRAANIRHYSNELIRRPDLVRYHPNIDDVLRWSKKLRTKPRALVPYANFVYFGTQQPSDPLLATATTNIEEYWRGDHVPPYAQPWKAELERLAAQQAAPVVVLHPMQGLRLK